MMATLNGRLARLEAAAGEVLGPDDCRTCGLRHVQPLTLEIVRGILRTTGMATTALLRETRPTPPLCLCDPCCGADPRERAIARMSHGLPLDEGAP